MSDFDRISASALIWASGGGGVHLALRPQKLDSLEGWYF